MANKPAAALRVAHLTESLNFYVDRLGFATFLHEAAADVAGLDLGELTILLAGPAARDLTPYLSQPSFIFQIGETLDLPIRLLRLHSTEAEAQRAELAARGVTESASITKPWGDRAIELRDPSGSICRFWTRAQLSLAESLALYEQGPDRLEAMVVNLSAADLDLALPGRWTVRQIVHHIADGDALWSGTIKAALAKSGGTYSHDWYSGNDEMDVALDYKGRAIEPSLALLRANRGHLSQLVRHLPDAGQRFVIFQRGEGEAASGEAAPTAVAFMLRIQAIHVLEHIEEIEATLKAHGR